MITLRDSINKRLKLWNSEIDFAKGNKVKEQLIRDKLRWRCRNDLFYLCCVTGHTKIAELENRYQPFCDEVSLGTWQVYNKGLFKKPDDLLDLKDVSDNPKEDLDDPQRLYLAFRGFYKSSIITKVHTIQLLLNYPNLKIVLCHNKQENSSDNLMAIKNMFLTTSVKTWFPEYIPDGKDWGNRSAFSVSCRTDWEKSEASVEAVGIGTEITGRHWHYAKKNDLVTEDSVTTKEQLDKTYKWDERFNMGHFVDIATPLQDYEGTRYHFRDLYSLKMKDNSIKSTIIPILTDFEDNSSCPVPERFDSEAIKSLKEKDPWTFWCQLMLQPKDPGSMSFTTDMICYYPTIPNNLKYVLLIDPATARKKKSDFTAMLVVGIDAYDNKYVVDGVRDKLDPKQRIESAFRLVERWDVKNIGWEVIGFQDTDRFYFEEERRLRKVLVNVNEIKSHLQSKPDRIRGLMPEYHNHKWYWPPKGAVRPYSVFTGRTYDLTEELEEELLQFPLGEHDDMIDTMTFLKEMSTTLKPNHELYENKIEKMTMGQLNEARNNRIASLERNPWKKLNNVYA